MHQRKGLTALDCLKDAANKIFDQGVLCFCLDNYKYKKDNMFVYNCIDGLLDSLEVVDTRLPLNDCLLSKGVELNPDELVVKGTDLFSSPTYDYDATFRTNFCLEKFKVPPYNEKVFKSVSPVGTIPTPLEKLKSSSCEDAVKYILAATFTYRQFVEDSIDEHRKSSIVESLEFLSLKAIDESDGFIQFQK